VTAPVVAVPAPGRGPGNWAGAPSAALDDAGEVVLAYRLRTAGARGGHVVVGDVLLPKERFGAESLERPALVRRPDGGWRLYVSCATPHTKHWRVDALDADTPAGFADAPTRTVLPGDERTAVKDPVVRVRPGGGWEAWLCCHPLDVAGEEDRMTTVHATSDDGLDWALGATVLAPGAPGSWDARGARATAVLPGGALAYDGRATKEENFSERTGRSDRRGQPVAEFRYLDVLELPDGRLHLAYEAPLADGSHELRVEYAGPSSPWR
jgi:hypothetical protein